MFCDIKRQRKRHVSAAWALYSGKSPNISIPLVGEGHSETVMGLDLAIGEDWRANSMCLCSVLVTSSNGLQPNSDGLHLLTSSY